MRAIALLIIPGVVTLNPVAARAQMPASQAAPRAIQQMHDEDGGIRETLESIVITPKAHAPFTATLQTEWVRNLYTGGAITLVNQRRIARDSNGRVYQERWFLVPKDGKQESRMTAIQISDPNRHELYTCMMDGRHICDEAYYSPSTSTVVQFEGPPTGLLPHDAGYASHEDLGKQEIAGMETIGTRDSTNYNPGVFGNDTQLTVEREYWYSPQLGINLLSKRSDPRFGTQTFTVIELGLAEPESQLFQLPAGFTAADHRAKAAGSAR